MYKINCNRCKIQTICKRQIDIEDNDLRFAFLQTIQVTENINLIKSLVNNFSKLDNMEIFKKIKNAKKYYKSCYWAN